MITEEEKEDIINAAVERALLRLPYVVGSLIDSHTATMKANKKFYDDHPEFKDHTDIVASVVEKVDGEDTLIPYCEKLRKAVPEIRHRIESIKHLDMDRIGNPNRHFIGSVSGPDNGEL